MGITICIEGPDGTGKSTQIRKLADNFRACEQSVFVRTFPAFGIINKIIRSMLASGAAKNWKNIFQFLFFVDRLIYQFFSLSKDLKKYDYVILDRWKASGFAYGSAEGVYKFLLSWAHWFIIDPDCTIILTGKSKRSVLKGDSYDKDKDLQIKVASNYIIYGMISNSNVSFVSNGGGIDSTSEKIFQIVKDKDGF